MTTRSSDSAALRDILESGAWELGLDLGDQEVEFFLAYLAELVEWNRKINLTAIRDEEGIIVRHFLDSIAVHTCLGSAETLLDIGAGAGFPGIPLKIVRPSLDVVLLDSVGKKVAFMRNVVRVLGLKGIKAVHGRVEAPDLIAQYRGGFDVVLSRAFAHLNDFLTVAAPYTRDGGRIIAVKGPRGGEELKEGAAPPHDFTLERVEEVAAPFSGVVSHYFIFRKESIGHG